jgi:diguanylate cyclase (GGDEF)-like protein/PAS domain S-box-containing protein
MAIPEDRNDAVASPPVEDGAAAQLRALDALLNIEGNGAAIAALLQSYRALFDFDCALALDDDGAFMTCIAAEPDKFVGRQWRCLPLLQDIARGRVLALGGARPDGEQLPLDLVGPGEPALLAPIAVGDRAAILILRRAAGRGDFTQNDMVLARQFAVLALALVGMRGSARLRGELERLRRLVDDAPHAEQQASLQRDLLKEIVEQLPIGLTIQDQDGRFIVANSVAAANLAIPSQTLIGSSPDDFLPAEEARQRRQWELDLLQSGRDFTTEEHHADAQGERTWLTSHKAVHVHDRSFLMSTSNDITDRKRVENELARRAYFDGLTGLPNRMVMQQRVEELLHRGDITRFALAFIDLDNFKHINDYYSHAIGDALLVKVAERIVKCLRDSDVLARISGDEFLLLVTPVDDERQVHYIIGQVLAELKKPFHIEAFEIFTSASLGVSVYPEHGLDYEALRRNADNAMYRAKNGTKGEAIYFNVAMGQTVTARMELEQRLRLAIRDRKFCCAFQPKVDIHSQHVLGFETLVRWRDDAGEIQPPSSFIDLAIELGLIDPITRFVLDEAVRSVDELDAAFGAETTISVNVAAKQAGDLNFMRSFVDALDDSGLADRLMIELTEDAFIAKNQFQKQVLPMLRQLGVRLSIDDFGTGYSSLSALADITADELKVDRSFITAIHQRPRSQSVLRAIESLGTSLGMSIVAEGIETFEELAYLQAATRIRYAQGYYFSKPFFLSDLKDAKFDSLNRKPESARPSSDGRRTQSSRGG